MKCGAVFDLGPGLLSSLHGSDADVALAGRAVRIALIAGVLCGAAACGNPRAGGSGVSAGTGTDSVKVIGVSLLTREQEFYQEVEAGIRTAAAKHGFRLIVTSGDFDLAKQQTQIDNFIVQHVDGIIVSPVNSQGVGPAINRATAAHIPVVTADTKAVGTAVVAHVASNNREGGQLAGAFMARALGDSGAVAVIGQQETHTGLERQQAFVDEIARHPRMSVAAIVNGGGLRDKALKVAEDVLQGHPDLRGISRSTMSRRWERWRRPEPGGRPPPTSPSSATMPAPRPSPRSRLTRRSRPTWPRRPRTLGSTRSTPWPNTSTTSRSTR